MQLLNFLREEKANTVTTVKTWLHLKIYNTYNIQLGGKMALGPELVGPKHSSTGSIQEAPAQPYPLAKAVSYDFSMIISLCLTHSEDLTEQWNNKWPKSRKNWRSPCCQKRQFYFHFSVLGRHKQPRMDNWSLLRQSAVAVMKSSRPKTELWGILVLFDFAFKCLHLSGWS